MRPCGARDRRWSALPSSLEGEVAHRTYRFGEPNPDEQEALDLWRGLLSKLGRLARFSRFFRTLKLLRMLKVTKVFEEIAEELSDEMEALVKIAASIFFQLGGLGHWIACIWVGLGYLDGHTWLSAMIDDGCVLTNSAGDNVRGGRRHVTPPRYRYAPKGRLATASRSRLLVAGQAFDEPKLGGILSWRRFV